MRKFSCTKQWKGQGTIEIASVVVSMFAILAGHSLKKGIVTLCVLFVGAIILLFFKERIVRKLSPFILIQLSWISIISMLFLIVAANSKLPVKKWYTMILLCFGSFFVFWMLFSLYIEKKQIDWRLIVKRLIVHRFFILSVISIDIIFSIYAYSVPRWDSEFYFYDLLDACRKFDFSWEFFFSDFRLAGHPASGYALFLAIGAFLTPGSVVGVQFVNLILLLTAIYFVYQIIRYTFPGISLRKAAAGAFLVACEPMMLSLSSEINLDFGVLIFGIYLFYMHIKGYRILFFFFGAILALTKENGILTLGGYIFGYLLSRFLVEKGSFWKRLKKCTGDFLFWGGIALLLLFLAYMAVTIISGNYYIWGTAQNTGSSGLAVADGSTDDLLNVFAFFNWNYVLLKLKTIFLMNFYWVFTGIVLCAVGYGIIRRKRLYRLLPKEYAGLYGAFAMNLLFSFAYVTHNNPRYNLYSEFVLVLTGVLILLRLMERCKRAAVLYCAVTVLFLVQSYTTVDPVTLMLFENHPTTWDGAHCVVLPAWNENGYLADTTVYNRQFSYLDRAFDQVLEECDYQGEDIILYGNQRGTYFAGRSFHYEWDTERKERVCEKTENSVPLKVVESDFYDRQKQGELSATAIYISVPEYIGEQEAEYLDKLAEFYTFGEKKTVSVWGQGEISYYELELK